MKTTDDDTRLQRGLETAGRLFQGSPSMPSFPVPAEIESDWTEFSIGTVMGDLWTRKGLDAKYRAVASIAALVALNRPEQLRAYAGIGLNLGLTRAELAELVMHMAAYAGFPAAIDGLRIVREVFEERDCCS